MKFGMLLSVGVELFGAAVLHASEEGVVRLFTLAGQSTCVQ